MTPGTRRRFETFEQLTAAIGEHLGVSDWLRIDQERIDGFAEATGDHQWIHVDSERAASGPFGATIAHGYLTLSLVPNLVAQVVEYPGWPVRVNYGAERVRFPAAVPVGSELRAAVTLRDVQELPSGIRVAVTVTMELRLPDGDPSPRPALAAEVLTLLAG